MEHRQVAFIGAGNMAQCILQGLSAQGYPAHCLAASNRSQLKLEQLHAKLGIQVSQSNEVVAQPAQVIVLAVKPQLLADVVEDMKSKGVDFRQKLVISVAAGVSVQRLKTLTGSQKIVRAMPNTPALVQAGLTGLYFSSEVTGIDREFSQHLFEAVGAVSVVQEEAQINAIIAAAGSAPAYFFLFMEAMQQQASEMGLSVEAASEVVRQAALGAAKLAQSKGDVPLDELRAQVTSKGGTTHQAIESFESNQLRNTVAQAMLACVDRAKEMEKQF